MSCLWELSEVSLMKHVFSDINFCLIGGEFILHENVIGKTSEPVEKAVFLRLLSWRSMDRNKTGNCSGSPIRSGQQ